MWIWQNPIINTKSENHHHVIPWYEMGGVLIFKILRKDCIFERLSIWTKKSENMSFQLQKLAKLECCKHKRKKDIFVKKIGIWGGLGGWDIWHYT